MTLTEILGLYNYWIVIFLMMTGFYIVISSTNLMKTVIGLNIFQTSVFLLYITMGKVTDGKGAPILKEGEGHDGHGHEADAGGEHLDHANETATSVGDQVAENAGELGDAAGHAAEQLYTNPLPSVLMLTAIVVGIATTALALALIVRIREDYGSIEEDEILELDRDAS
ncbi:MAG: cation:proton antiporter subunit C [Planctomycetota bacterium]